MLHKLFQEQQTDWAWPARAKAVVPFGTETASDHLSLRLESLQEKFLLLLYPSACPWISSFIWTGLESRFLTFHWCSNCDKGQKSVDPVAILVQTYIKVNTYVNPYRCLHGCSESEAQIESKGCPIADEPVVFPGIYLGVQSLKHRLWEAKVCPMGDEQHYFLESWWMGSQKYIYIKKKGSNQLQSNHLCLELE